jgi:hypothetical protein
MSSLRLTKSVTMALPISCIDVVGAERSVAGDN